MASSFWDVPRTTHDLDFVVSYELESTTEIVAAFEEA